MIEISSNNVTCTEQFEAASFSSTLPKTISWNLNMSPSKKEIYLENCNFFGFSGAIVEKKCGNVRCRTTV